MLEASGCVPDFNRNERFPTKRGRVLHVFQALDFVFCVDRIEHSELKFSDSDCEFLRCGEAVIEVGRL